MRFVVLVVLAAAWVTLVVLGIRVARAKGRSPHWMWFGLHPLGALVAFLILRFGVKPRAEVRAREALLQGRTICTACFQPFKAAPKQSFLGLGFQEFSCPSCKKNILYPLTSGYRVTYWIIAVTIFSGAILAFFLEGLSTGKIIVPGLLPVLAVVALLRDLKIRRNVQAAEDHFRNVADLERGVAPART